MTMIVRAGLLALGLAMIPAASQAHFKLLAPPSWMAETALGDPQKSAPCGGTKSAGLVHLARSFL